jgi:hypothetical protein
VLGCRVVIICIAYGTMISHFFCSDDRMRIDDCN